MKIGMKIGMKRDRIDRILENSLYRECVERNERAETDRIFCRHHMQHFLDVARIAQILNLTEEYGIVEELVYTAALLHDIGRYVQYENGTPHETAGADLAPAILKECGFDEGEIQSVVRAIASHRQEETAGDRDLSGLLFRADKMSRSCFICKAEKECNRKAKRKNRSLQW